MPQVRKKSPKAPAKAADVPAGRRDPGNERREDGPQRVATPAQATTSGSAVTVKTCQPGIYFGMSDEEYHSYFALSSSGMKWLRVSPLDYWTRSPLNPKPPQEDSVARKVGRAYDKRIIEGKDVFYKIYARAADPRQHQGLLRTNEDLKRELEARSQPVGGNKTVLIERLLGAWPEARWKIWDIIEAQHKAQYPNREFLDNDLVDSIEIAAAMIEKHPQLCKAFTDGMPKVAIFYIDRDYGIPMKCQLDFLKAQAIVDLKTFDNSRGLPILKAVAGAVASYKYHVQARQYLDGVEEAKAFIDNGRVFGTVDKDFLKSVRACAQHTFLFVFQQKGEAPLARGMVMPPGMTLSMAHTVIDECKRIFKENWDRFGTAPWLDISDVGTFDTTDFPPWIAD